MSAFDAFSDELDAFLDADAPATLAADELSALEAVEAGLDDDAEGGVRGGARRWKGAGGGRDAAALSKTEREERAAQEALESLRGVASGMQRSVQGLGPAGGPAAAGAPSTGDVRALAHDLLAELGAPQPAAATAGHAAVVGGGQVDALPPGAQRAVLTPAPSPATSAPTNATTTTAAGAPSAALEDARAAMAAMTLAATVNTPGTGTTPADAEATAALRATLTPGPAATASPASAAATNPVASRPAADTATQPAAPSESSGSDDAQLDALLAGLGAPLPGSAPRPPAATATASTVSSSSSSSGSSGSGAPPVTSAELDELLAQL